MELGHLDKHSLATQERKALPEKISDFFAWKLLKIAFYMTNFAHRCQKSGHFFPKLGQFFPTFEKRQGRPPPSPPLVTPPRPAHLVSYEYCEIFKNAYFEKHLQKAAFEI